MSERRQRANGRASRAAILDAAAQVAGERGYEGTTIKLVSERSGLPASSIYWHFENKDALIAAVIDRSYEDWVDAVTGAAVAGGSTEDAAPGGVAVGDSRERAESDDEAFVAELRAAGEHVAKFPDFLRLGLMLTLERRPDEPEARRRFQAGRRETRRRLVEMYRLAFVDLDESAIDQLVTLTLAGSDGIFVAAQADGVDTGVAFETLALAVLGAAERLRDPQTTRRST